MGRQGLTALDHGDFATADDRLTRAIALHDVLTLRLARAQARRALGRFISAGEDYRAVIRVPETPGEPAVFSDARRDARAELATLEPQIPRLTLRVEGGPATIRVGGFEWPEASIGVPRPIDPGEYVVEVFPRTGAPSVQRLIVGVGEQRELTLHVAAVGSRAAPALPGLTPMPREASPPPGPYAASPRPGEPSGVSAAAATPRDSEPNRTGAYVAVGTAAVFAAAAIATGALYLFKLKPDYDEANKRGEPSAPGARDKAQTMGWISTAFTGGAIIAGGVGAYLFLSADTPAAEEARAGIRMGGLGRTEFGVTGRF